MASLGSWAEYIAARNAALMACRLSPQNADALAVRLGSLAYRFMTRRREGTIENLRKAFGHKYSESEIEDLAMRVFQNVSRSLIETARFQINGVEGIRPMITGEGREIIDRAHNEGKGAIILTAHFGNWEMLGSFAATLGYPMDFLVGIQHNPLVHDMYNDWRRAAGVGIINVGQASRLVLRGLKQNRFIGIAADQHAPSLGVIIDFFGRPASFARGPAVFALRAGCPLLLFLLRRERYDRHVLVPGEPIYPEPTGNEDHDVRAIMTRYARFLEDNIRRYPDQWMWTHRRWKIDTVATADDGKGPAL